MSFVKKATPPPAVEEGDILKAKILNISKVTSKWKDENGNPREQLKFELELDNGYRFRSWIAYYEHPSDKSKLGKLALKFMELTKQDFATVDEFLDALKKFGHIYVSCTGFREYEEELYPNFAIVTTKLPPLQQNLTENTPRRCESKQLLAKFSEALRFGLPLNQEDWNKSLSVEERIFLLKQGFVEEKDGLYFFTEKARALFQQKATAL